MVDTKIIKVVCNDTIVTPNSTTYIVPVDGTYTIYVYTDDPYTIPACIIVDSTGCIGNVQLKTQSIPSTDLTVNVLRNMKINGVKTDISGKRSVLETYTTNKRLSITF